MSIFVFCHLNFGKTLTISSFLFHSFEIFDELFGQDMYLTFDMSHDLLYTQIL